MLEIDSGGEHSGLYLSPALYKKMDEPPKPKFFPDHDFSLEGQYQIKDVKLRSLLVAQGHFPSVMKDYKRDTLYFSLVVRCVNENEKIYERVGILEHDFILDVETVERVRLTLV